MATYMKTTRTLILLMLLLMAAVSPAVAYIGPGAGISVLGSLLGILTTIVVAIGDHILAAAKVHKTQKGPA